MYTFHDQSGVPITLTFDPKEFHKEQAMHVLVFPYYQGKLLLTIHTKRGIELPGGKVEPGESSIAAAVRETYEETGYHLSSITKIGQYTVGSNIVKDIYLAEAERQVAIIREGSVGGAVLYDEPPRVKDLLNDPKFSPFMKDDVYPLALAEISKLQMG
ncbi:NUDIX domain-containing protein [Brevibacillus daliensis]|uniref:NUDIX domain-containing protein n=1 Tax=Brevibacillus daliensis TaxID=2892995 RepID=UPI001E39A880|nr:NUDIX domain-containing protein [Brevibacillus daliensis]